MYIFLFQRATTFVTVCFFGQHIPSKLRSAIKEFALREGSPFLEFTLIEDKSKKEKVEAYPEGVSFT